MTIDKTTLLWYNAKPKIKTRKALAKTARANLEKKKVLKND